MRRMGLLVLAASCSLPMACSLGSELSDEDANIDTDTDNIDTPQAHMDADDDTHPDTNGLTTARHLNPGRPVYASNGNALNCNDGAYGVDYWGVGTEKDNTWTAVSPAWCAVDLGNIEATEVLVVLSDEQRTESIEGLPGFRDYVLETSADSTDGDDGTWQKKITVTDNTFGYRAHRLSFSGDRWLRVTVQKPKMASLDELDVFDVSNTPADVPDSIIWVGDSITARCADRHGAFGANPSLQAVIRNGDDARYPIQIGAGFVSMGTAGMLDGAESKIDTLLSLYPDIRFWALALGTNDATGDIHSDAFRDNIMRLVDKIERAGHQAIIARIPYSPHRKHRHSIERLNAVIDDLTEEMNLTPGPNLYRLFKQNAHRFYDESDRVHPNSTGCTAWQQAFAMILNSPYHRTRQRVTAMKTDQQTLTTGRAETSALSSVRGETESPHITTKR